MRSSRWSRKRAPAQRATSQTSLMLSLVESRRPSGYRLQSPISREPFLVERPLLADLGRATEVLSWRERPSCAPKESFSEVGTLALLHRRRVLSQSMPRAVHVVINNVAGFAARSVNVLVAHLRRVELLQTCRGSRFVVAGARP
jgi:hypothetical protein